MEISFVAPGTFGPGAVALGVADGAGLTGIAAQANAASGGAIKRAMDVTKFTGREGKVVEVLAPANVKASRFLVVGLGKAEKFDGGAAERAAAKAVARMLHGEPELTLAFDLPKRAKVNEAELAAHAAFGAMLRSYNFDRYMTKLKDEDKPTLKAVRVATKGVAAARKEWAELAPVAEGIFVARDLVNEPANILYPDEFARRAKPLSKLGVKVEILGVPEMKKLGMGALIGVGQGSSHESRLLVLQYNGARSQKAEPIAFVGKGVCFDSGGLSLKPAVPMMGMKGDMGGAAAVVGLIHTLAARKAKANVVGVCGLVENMPDGNAQRPNDIVRSMSGQTIEVLNTDAEGRLVLADAIWYAHSRFKPKFVVNLATLTGAIMIALGTEHAGMFSNNDELAKRITQAGIEEGEPVWRMPLGAEYDKAIKSKIADMKNIGGPYGGSITAAQFLQRFVNGVPWAHLDIAGVAWQDSEYKPLAPTWGTGWGVRVLNRLVADHYEK